MGRAEDQSIRGRRRRSRTTRAGRRGTRSSPAPSPLVYVIPQLAHVDRYDEPVLARLVLDVLSEHLLAVLPQHERALARLERRQDDGRLVGLADLGEPGQLQ